MKSLAELKAIRDRMQGEVNMRGRQFQSYSCGCRHGNMWYCQRRKTGA